MMYFQNGLAFDYKYPEEQLSPFIQYFWTLGNQSDTSKKVTILPDGFFDLMFVFADGLFKTILVGLATVQQEYVVPAGSRALAISFKLPAAEYLLGIPVRDLLNSSCSMSDRLWHVDGLMTLSFVDFCAEFVSIFSHTSPAILDERKRSMFEILYGTRGHTTVHHIAEITRWSSRQINRYFQTNFGVSLKAYSDILRFRSTFDDLHQGDLFPAEGYSDQPHFIKEVKKFAGTSPKYLAKNLDDRFIQLSTLGHL